ncbi:MAG: enoyl-CoA hydratase/isomerase family protein [Myxococcota bacterium]
MGLVREDAGGIATLTLNRPEKLNALDIPSIVALREEIDRLAVDENVACVVLTGAGRSFCAGHDLESIAAGERAPSKHFESETVEALEQLPMPTIAKIRGHCFTGGLELALGCDLLIAAEDAKLGDTHGQWGLVPVWGMSVRLPERVGLPTAKELMFTSRRISGSEAGEIGLVDRVCPAEQLDASVDALAAEIAANSPDTNRMVKRLLRTHADTPRSRALDYERQAPYGMPRDMKERMGGRPSRKKADPA